MGAMFSCVVFQALADSVATSAFGVMSMLLMLRYGAYWMVASKLLP